MKKSQFGWTLLGAAIVFSIGSVARVSAAETAASNTSSKTKPATSAVANTATNSSPTTTTTSSTPEASTDEGWEGVRTVVVSATRAETEIAKTGTSISVVSQKEIERQQYRSVGEALREVPGVNISNSGTPGQVSTVMIRGAKTSENSVFLDGRRLPFNLAGGFNVETLSLANVDRVEVARGPVSSVNGGASIGGAINIVSRDGRGQETPLTETFFEAGSFNTFREGVSSWGSEGNFDYSTGVVRLDTDNQRLNNEYRNTSSLNKLGYQITPDLYFDTHVIYSLADIGSPNNITTNDRTANVLRELWGVSPGLNWKTTEIWTQSVYYGRYQYRQVASGNAPDQFVGTTGLNNRVQVDTDQIDYQSVVQIFENWKMTGGVSGSNISYYLKLDETDNYSFPSVPGGTKPVDDGQTNTGYFVESQWEIVKGWNFISNFRFDHYSDFGDAATYRFATSYEVPDLRTLLHANYGTSYAPPTPQDVAGYWSGNTKLSPEQGKGYEFGVTQPFWGDKVSVFGTWFHNDVNNYIVWDSTAQPGFPWGTGTNVGHAVMEGVESGFTVKPVKQVRINTSYTNLSAIRESDNLQSFSSRLARAPRHTVNASVSYSPIEPLTFTLAGNYVADRVDGSPVREMENYLNMRFMANWKINKYLEVFGRIENLTNDQYQEVLGYPALDQAYYGGFKVTF